MDAYTLALGWLARRELTERQVRQRLVRRGLEGDEIDAAVARLRREGALDDRRVAGAYARTAVRLKARGPVRLEHDLQTLGIDRGAAGKAVADAIAGAGGERALAAQALARRWRAGTPPSRADAARLHRALLRQGFSPDAVREAIRNLGGAGPEPDDPEPGPGDL